MLSDLLGSQKPRRYNGAMQSFVPKCCVKADLALVDFAEKILLNSSVEWESQVVCQIVKASSVPQQYTGLLISECIQRNDWVGLFLNLGIIDLLC
jgi:hypothetical protein